MATQPEWNAEKLGEEVRRLRKAAEMTQEELGEYCALSRASIANIERGHHRIHADTLVDLAVALEVKPCDLLLKAM